VDVLVQRKRRAKQVATAVLVGAATIAIFVWGPDWIRPSVKRSRIRTAKVDVGPLDATISASGTVVPEVEQVLSSPVNARVLRVLKRPGASVRAGEPIVELDVSESVLAVEKMARNLALKDNEQARTRLALDKRLIDLEAQREIKQLQLESLKLQRARNGQLFKEGLIAQETLRQSEVAEAQAVIELKQLEREKQNAEQSTRTEIDGLALEMATLRKERTEAERQLELATTRAGRDGILTWGVTEEGATLTSGQVIARIADLSSFRVDATVSDVHARHLAVGLPVAVRIGEETLEGAIVNVLPTIQNGIMTLSIALREKSSPLLRSNLRVDVSIITGRRTRALRVAKGPFADGEGARNVFVVRGDRAVRMPVQIGIASFDRLEIVNGLSEGDEIVISDMRDYLHLREVRIR
jgi:HlyD family secretion protein